MTSRTMRILSIITGALLIAAGIYCLCNQDVAAMSAGIVLGLLMLIAGIVEIVIFAGTSRFILGSGWLLLDGVLTVVMSLFLLFNHWFTMMSLPILFPDSSVPLTSRRSVCAAGAGSLPSASCCSCSASSA